MAKTYSITEFIRLTPFEKQRLRESDPAQYQKLFAEMEKQFPKDDNSASSFVSGAKTNTAVHTVE
jgi:hypothetical protein